MPRTATAWGLAAGLVIVSGVGCRGLHRHDNDCESSSRHPPPCPSDGCGVSFRKGVSGAVPPLPPPTSYDVTPTYGPPPGLASAACPDGNCGGSSFGGVPAIPSSFGGPVYPVGAPVPLRSPTASPANELPYPTIPTPNVPEGPTAVPTPASPTGTYVPPAAARTTGDAKGGK